jgi:hypothetical protein
MAYCGLMPWPIDLLPPFGERSLVGPVLLLLPDLNHRFDRLAGIGNDRQVDADILVDLRRIDVDMDLLRPRREGIDAPRHAVVEAGAEADHHVAIVHRVVGFVGAVHAEHAEPFVARSRIGSQAHQRRCHREACQLDQFAQMLARRRAGIDDAAAGIEDRLLGRGHQRHGLTDRINVRLERRLVGAVGDAGGLDVEALLELDVLRDVDHHRTGTARGRDLESLVQDARQVGDVLHQPVMLGARPGDADGIAFLERVGADQMGRDLTRENHDRDRVEQRIGKPGHRIGGAGARGHQRNAAFAGRTGITLGGMHGALLVTDQNVDEIVGGEQRIVNRQYRAAGIAENVLNTVVLERLDHHFGASHFFYRRDHRLVRIFVLTRDPWVLTRLLLCLGKAKGALPPLCPHDAALPNRVIPGRSAASK